MQSTSSKFQEFEQPLSDNPEMDRSYFLAGYHWNDESQLDRFVKEGVWINGNKNRLTEAVNSAKPGDVLFAKTIWGKGEAEGILTLQAVGVVAQNVQDGRNLRVNWFPFADRVDLKTGSHYRYSFQLIREKYLPEILKGVQEQVPDLQAIISRLSASIDFITQPDLIENVLSRTVIINDGAYAGEDLLNIENDVRSFALLLASKEVKPPLAIALFGRWGSGKSFFMRQLKKRVARLSENQGFALGSTNDTQDLFCRGIAQIEFNAWSYLDSNLWAGLISSIFEKLDEFISDRSKGDHEKLLIRKKLSEKLHVLASEKQLIEEKKSDLIIKQEDLKGRLDKLHQEKAEMLSNVANKQLDDLIDQVRKDVGLEQRDIDELEEYGLSRERVAVLNPVALKEELMSWVTFVRNLFCFSPKHIFWFSVSFLLAILIAINPNDFLTRYLDFVGRNVAIIAGIVGPFVVKWVNTFNKYRGLLKPVIDYKNAYNNALENAKFQHQKEVELIEANLQQKQQEITQVEVELANVTHKIKDIEFTLEHFIAQRAFNNFIQKKISNKSYDAHLGLISIIRRDFETLSDLFAELSEDSINNDIEERKAFKKLFKEERVLDRIVLYIDDLDRCSDDKVLEVIQAVHLLMAFPLFNVVVGVDKRCVRNALLLKTKLEYRKIAKIEEIEEMGVELITPGEYLEKIFQIPFELREPESSDLERLVEGVLESEIEEEVVMPDQKGKKSPVIPSNGKRKSPDQPQLTQQLESIPHPLVSSSIDSLKLTEQEVVQLKQLVSIVGNTPRTIKRFLNIYRMIRSHTILKYDKNTEQDVFLFIMFLLAVSTGKYRRHSVELNQTLYQNNLTVQTAIKQIYGDAAPSLIEDVKKHHEIARLLKFKGALLDDELIQFIGRFSYGQEMV
ncbi:KAP family NTPase [Marinoscillum pacificum]|uniref:KAP family NTPase n=1 Tax=Marinoscillum pacificum TaxID=392723 RepID=UPI00215860C6|nr:KAP family NTPase [Marinoscillum pacificum]